MDKPKISVIVPVYNVEQYLEKCICSILSQDFANYELILVDDGSTDNSSAICDDFSKKSSKVKVFHQGNKGVSIARNVGLSQAAGRFIVFADADDYFLPGAFGCLYELIVTSGADMALANSIVKNGPIENKLFMFQKKESDTLFKDIQHFALWGYIFDASLIENNKIRFIDSLAYSEDRLFINNLMLYARKILFSNKVCYVHRVNPTSACASKDLMRKAYHQFFASSELIKLRNIASNLDEKKYFANNSYRIKKNAIFDLVYHSYSFKNMKLVYDDYKKNFPKRASLSFLRIYIPLFFVDRLKKFVKYILGIHH